MMRTFKTGLTIGMMVAALALSGCGDNDNSGENSNGNDNSPGPIRTATPGPVATATPTPSAGQTNPTATATPGGNPVTQTVDFDLTATEGIQAFQIQVAYDTADGSFTGTAENAGCTVTGGGGIFTKNDNDQGVLILSVANTANLTFPVNVECTFDATSGITADDLTVTVQEVTQNSAPGDIADLTVAVTVAPAS